MSDVGWKPLPLLTSYLEKWANETPDVIAMLQHETGEEVTYREFLENVELYALRLLDLGIRKGDRVATMLLTTLEHYYLMYACFLMGAIVAPIDIRLKEAEVVQDLAKIEPSMFFFLGNTPMRDFREVGRAVKAGCPSVKHLVQVSLAPGEEVDEDFISFQKLMDRNALLELRQSPAAGLLEDARKSASTLDGTIIIFTTGTTGPPKPALLSHQCIIAQNEILSRLFGYEYTEFRTLCNLPPSHVAGTSELAFTTFYRGGTLVLLRLFNPELTLEAIEKRRVTILGMIPTQFRMVWALPNYKDYDLSSLEGVFYAGAPGDLPFLKQLYTMAPIVGTGIGMTENAGFATATPHGIPPEEMAGQVGRPFPDVADVTIRKPMNPDGTAGEELPDGEVGEICYHPPLVFIGYFNQPEETAKTVSKEGILYTGDMGYFKDMGTYRALYLAGRRKFMIKQKGYNVFPDEVQNHIMDHPKVALAEVVGVPHRVFDEGIFAFVLPKPGETLTPEEIIAHCQSIASYKRPQHVEIWPADRMFLLTRMGKIDKPGMRQLALSRIEELRQAGGWDAGA